MSKGYDDIHRYKAVGLPAGGIIDELARKPALSHVRNHAVRLLLELHPVALSLTHEDADRNEGVGQRHNPDDEGEHDEEALSGRYRGHVTKGCRPQKKKSKSLTFLYQVTILLTFFSENLCPQWSWSARPSTGRTSTASSVVPPSA